MGVEMRLNPVRMADSDSEEKIVDLVQRLKRVENWIDEVSMSRGGPSHSGAEGLLPMRKTKRERPRRRSLTRSSESESETNYSEMIEKKRHRQRLRGSGVRNQMKRWDEEESSESDFGSTEKREEEQERSEDFLGIFPDEWLTPRRQAGELKRFVEFCKAGSIRINDDVFNTFIQETEKSFFTRHTDASWNALKATGVTAEWRKDSPEAVRVIEFLQPALESVFEAANAIAALSTRELRKTRFEEEEKERLRGLFCSFALIANSISRINFLKVIPHSNWENEKCFLEGGTSKDVPESLRRLVESTSFFRPVGDVPVYGASPASPTAFGLITARRGRSRRSSTDMNAQGFAYRQLLKHGLNGSFTNFRERRRSTHPLTASPSITWESGHDHSSPPPSSPEDTGRTSNMCSFWIEPMGIVEARGKKVALRREIEREERSALCCETEINRTQSNSEGVTMPGGVSFNRQMVTRTEPVGKNEQKSEKEEEKIVWRASGTVIESPIGSPQEASLKTAIAYILEGEENTQIQHGHKTQEVKRSQAIGPPKELLPGRLVNRLSEWKKIGGDKLVSRDDEQLFIPLGGGVDGWSGEAHTGVGGEVVQPDIHGDKEKRKVEKNPGLQSSKRGRTGKAFQDGFPGDSGGTPGGERLDDNSGHIECIPACQSVRVIQSLSVFQLSKSMLRSHRDAIWSEKCFQSFHEDNEKGGVIYQRKVESEASDIPGRHSPHAPRQGCIEIDLTGDSPVPERSGLDTVGRETEV
ncbi:uncharacterized protein MONOS_6080 [Monocercomonoides exilis]|uniref:uncharacterized protein n=1 Tax=Monocercomonoides exilis TaxID=2049356 RepID=UPI0035594B14|nr:hypothetical protein MONOS_6080 [Monocercomonoides exilis]|eukprot:MONOS_6080.1-p1 / transcript=MONOS_6080.1 / gene=MONOS_6080 / organism=Monocercomonoides_exilis_PA203 / gene_product=unspecified product / transcript_product=unspecified product / location=Mono_scaffold00187:6037-8584(+) / protein_length=755 / sequence_SO=supercontig / SO=protein_coding / is_pseudo=false